MNALVYSKPFFPSLGGLERNTLTLCLALEELGHDVQLFTETPHDGADDYAFTVTRSTSMLAFARLVWDSDLLIVNGGMSLRTVPFALLSGTPYVIIYHTYLGFRREGQGVVNEINNGLREVLAERAAANVFTSSYSEENTDVGRSPAHVVLNPVDKHLQALYEREETDDASDATSDESSRSILFAGRIIEGKGVFVLMDALERLDGHLHVEVVFAGTGPAVQALKSRAASLSTVSVDFPGNLGDEALVHVYHEASVLVVPTSTHNEGNPLVIAEALYAGTPVIASDQPPMIEAVGEAGLIFESGDDEELSALLENALGDDIAYQCLKQRARERRAIFSYASYVEQVERVMRKIEKEEKTIS